MKQVQWFPGHMFKSFREMKERLKLIDIMIILVDARIPYSSMNPEILKLVGEKPTLLLFNKMDLTDRKSLNQWIKYYENLGFYTLEISSETGFNINRIYTRTKEILSEKIQKMEAKGAKFGSIRAMIVGIPNVGKSTLINKLANKKVAVVGNKPGVTKSQQWIKIKDDFELLDTPGVLWPKFDDPEVGLNLAVTGAIKDETLPLHEVCNYLISYLVKHYKERLVEKYSIENIDNLSLEEIYDAIGKKRGALEKGGFVDYDRVMHILLNDVRSKALGALSFDNEKLNI
nr:ribosome biogenesis GTPase YlqF [Acholeplasma equifetale]